MKNINKILNQQAELIKPSLETLKKIERTSESFCGNLRKKLRSKKIKADVFIGGSLAKKTLVKKDKYDVDIFVRFDRKYEDKKISKLLEGILTKAKKIHGSRDYYQLIINGIIFEIIPVLKIKKPEQAENITDLSYFHVNYVLNKIRKNKKLADEIILAKTFAYAQDCYGAESYIHGFSGYAIELLICHYGSFLKFIKSISLQNIKQVNISSSSKLGMKRTDYVSDINKIIIDDSKFYKNKQEVLRELNESKIQSPIILIDPTFKERNALASLSQETFLKFKKTCKDFLKNPSSEFFERKNIFEELSRKYKDKLRIVSVKTNKQAGDIAGSKSKKFFEFFCNRLRREFEIKKAEFDYDEKKNTAYFYFVLEKKKDEVIKGPPVTAVHNLSKFKKAHKNAFIKKHIAYAKIKHDLSFVRFFNMFKRKYEKVVREMGVKSVKFD